MTLSLRRPARGADERRGNTRGAELADRVASLEAAQAAHREACLSHQAQTEVRGRCQDVIAAYDRAIAAAEADLRAVLGPLDGLPRTKVIAARHRSAAQASQRVLDRLRLARQRHLLTASPSCGASHSDAAEADGRGPLGPFWPETDYLPERDVYGTRRILSPQHR